MAKLGGRSAVRAGRDRAAREPARSWSRSSAAAAERGQPVRASGSGHSFSDIALTDGVMVRCDSPRPGTRGRPRGGAGQGRGRDRARRRSTASSTSSGSAFENLGDIDRQTLAGSIATGTHGTGARFRSVSAQVEAVEMVLADGSSLEISAASDPAGLAAARIGLGALGIVYAVDDPHRPRLHARPRRQPAAARRRPWRASTSSTPPTTTSSSTSSRTPRPRSAARAAARTSRRGRGRRRWSTPRR